MCRMYLLAAASILTIASGALAQVSNPYQGDAPNPYSPYLPSGYHVTSGAKQALTRTSSEALQNTRLDKLKDQLKRGDPLPRTALDAKVLQHINLATQAFPLGLGLLRAEGTLDWPALFKEPAFKTKRERIDSLLREAWKQARKDKLPEPAFKELTEAVKLLDADVDEQIAEVNASQWLDAKRFTVRLRAEAGELKKGEVEECVKLHERLVRCKTLADLVAYMTKEKLTFAPATPRDLAAYKALARILNTAP